MLQHGVQGAAKSPSTLPPRGCFSGPRVETAEGVDVEHAAQRAQLRSFDECKILARPARAALR